MTRVSLFSVPLLHACPLDVDSWTNWHATNVRGEHSRVTSYYVGVWNP